MAKRITVQNMCTVLKAQQHHFKLSKYNNRHLTSEDTRIINKYGDKIYPPSHKPSVNYKLINAKS